MGYLDPSLLSSSIDSAKCRVPAYAMAYINAMENGVDCDGPYNKLRSMIYMIKILECVQPEAPGAGTVIPPSNPCPPCPPSEYTELVLRMNSDFSSFSPDWTIIYMDWSINIDDGTNIGSSGIGPLDLTTPAGRNDALNEILYAIDYNYSTTSSGTITLVGDVITIDITAPITGDAPVPVIIVSFNDYAGGPPVLAASIPL